mgnify:FL=1
MARVANAGLDKTYESAGDLSLCQFTFVKGAPMVAGGQQAQLTTCGANGRMVGIQQNTPDAAGLALRVRFDGTSKLLVDGTQGGGIAVGSPLKSDAAGRGIKAAGDKNHVGAYALEASTALGDIIEVLIVDMDLAV